MAAGKSRGGVTESGGEKGEPRASKERRESSPPAAETPGRPRAAATNVGAAQGPAWPL